MLKRVRQNEQKIVGRLPLRHWLIYAEERCPG